MYFKKNIYINCRILITVKKLSVFEKGPLKMSFYKLFGMQ